MPALYFDADDRVVLASAGTRDEPSSLRHEDGSVTAPVEDLVVRGAVAFYTVAGAADAMSGADSLVYRFDMTTGKSRPLTAIRRAWVAEAQMRTRENYVATGDGTRLLVTAECELLGPGERPTTLAKVVDVATGNELVSGVAWRRPTVGAGPLVAGENDAAIVAPVRGGNDLGLTLWMDGHAVAIPGQHNMGLRTRVFDDGIAVLETGDVDESRTWSMAGYVVAPDGGTIVAWDKGQYFDVATTLRRGRYVFVVARQVADPDDRYSSYIDILHRVDVTNGNDLESGRGSPYAEWTDPCGSGFLLDADASGQYVAMRYVPGITEREVDGRPIS